MQGNESRERITWTMVAGYQNQNWHCSVVHWKDPRNSCQQINNKKFDIIWKSTENKTKDMILLQLEPLFAHVLWQVLIPAAHEGCSRVREGMERVARIIMVIEKLLYEKMLKRMEVFNSENRVMEGEINIYKTIKQWIKWMKNCYSLYHNTGTRGCPSKLFRNQFKRPPRLVTQTLPCTACSSVW